LVFKSTDELDIIEAIVNKNHCWEQPRKVFVREVDALMYVTEQRLLRRKAEAARVMPVPSLPPWRLGARALSLSYKEQREAREAVALRFHIRDVKVEEVLIFLAIVTRLRRQGQGSIAKELWTILDEYTIYDAYHQALTWSPRDENGHAGEY
jgi:hypothetical protein